MSDGTSNSCRPSAGRDLSLEQRIALLSGSDFWHTRDFPDNGVPKVLLSDGPHGLRVQQGETDHLGLAGAQPATCFPTAVTLAGSWDEQLVSEVGRAVAVEARALGVDVVLGPGMNIKRHPLCGRNFEYFSEDPLLTGRLAAAMVGGIQSRGVGACLKHFAVNNQEFHRFVLDAVVDERTMREIYLAGFEHTVTAARPWAVMAAYNSVNGEPATENRRLLTGILREEWGFDGIVVSDWGATGDRVRGVAAGMDLEMPNSCGISDGVVADAVRTGQLDPASVSASAQRVLDLVDRAPRPERGAIPRDEHDALARRAATEGTVLLTNDGTLPLADDSTVAVIGAFAAEPRYQGSGSSQVTPTRLTTALEAFEARGVTVTYAAGYDPKLAGTDPGLVEEAAEAARDADVAVVLIGLPGSYESEGFDRDHLNLPAQHDELVAAVCAANPRTVVVLSNGAPVRMPWRDRPAAILEAYLGGQASGGALVDVLYGDAEPGGRLAETFPVEQTDVAAAPWFPGDPHQVEYREGLFVGYRHATTSGVQPAFAFGHGLGYTTFEWGPAALDRDSPAAGEDVAVSVPVTNTGDRAGSDVVQVYLHDRTGVVLRPRRELGGFAKVRLSPGESATVTIEVGPRAFAFYDVDAADWRIPSGAYDLEIARSSVDVVQTRAVEVHGGVTEAPQPVDTSPLARTDEQFRRRLGRPIPTPRPVRPFTRDTTLGEAQQTRFGRLLRKALWRAMPIDEATRNDENSLRMMRRMVDEMPLRAVALFSGGKLRWDTVDVIVDVLNGRTLSATTRCLRLLRRLPGRVAGRHGSG